LNPSALFIRRPVATILLTLAIALVGIASYFVLPVAALPSVDLPTIFVQASLPGGSPEVMATSVATPLERRFGEIADLSELTSSSSTNSTRIIMQFGLDRDINGAARDVEAAINAARADLPTSLHSNPTYRKVNPAEAPIMILNLTSDSMTTAQMYDAASTIIQQKLSQMQGIGEVDLGGGANPAVRVELNPNALAHYGIGLEDVRAAISAANGNVPKGQITAGSRKLQIYTNDQGYVANDYKPIVIAYRDGAAVKLSDVAEVDDSVEDIHNLGLANGKPAILVIIRKSPNANVIATVDRIQAALPLIRAQLPPAIQLNVSVDRTLTIRASLLEVERTLLIAIILVVLVVLVFLRNGRATLIPGVAVTVSLLGTLAVMFLFKYSLDNLSLMALTVATGFVVDDAIVVLENITRHVENGMPRFQAALVGSAEVGFTVISMSISLIAVFIPILLMGGIVGRFFREFAVTLSASILISLFVSLTATPMMAARMIDEKIEPDAGGGGPRGADRPKSLYKRATGKLSYWFERSFGFVHETYEDSLNWALDHSLIVLLSLFATIILTGVLYVVVPKGFFPQEDTGQLQGGVQVDQASSFLLTRAKFKQIVDIIGKDPAVQTVSGFSGSGNAGIFAQLKPQNQRGGLSADQVIQRLRPQLFRVPGAQTFLQTVQDIRVGGRQSNAEYQYTLEADDLDELQTWAGKLGDQLKKDPTLTDVNSDQQPHGLETYVNINYDAAARLGLTVQQVDNALGDSFGQAQVSTIYNPLNQYKVVMEVAPQYSRTPQALDQLYVSTANAAGSNLTGGSGVRAAGTGAQTAILPTPIQTLDAQIAATARQPTTMAGLSSLPVPIVRQTNPSTGTSVSLTANSAATTATVVGGVFQSSGLSGAGSTPSTGGGGRAQTGTAVATTKEREIPLSAFATYAPDFTPVAVNHQDGQAATTLSFNLPPGKSLSDAQTAIARAVDAIHMPTTIHGGFRGTAQVFQQSFASVPVLILSALVAVYIVLGVLYESYVHPITVLSTIPSAGVGAVLALIIFHVQFDIIALIGVILLIGIVKKNAIMIIDFALTAEREQGLSTRDAIYQACMLRFRPILMTTFAAILGALPLALGLGVGGELRRPLGIAIIGGLAASQVLTLLTTPVVYLYMDKLRKPRPRSRLGQRLRGGLGGSRTDPAPQAS
jgi:multidrug efflux pump